MVITSRRVMLVIELIATVTLTASIVILSNIMKPNLYMIHGWIILIGIQLVGLLKVVFNKTRKEAMNFLLVGYVICTSITFFSGLVLSLNFFEILHAGKEIRGILVFKPMSFIFWGLMELALTILAASLLVLLHGLSIDFQALAPSIGKIIFYENLNRKVFLATFFLGFLLVLIMYNVIGIAKEFLQIIVFLTLGLYMNLETSVSLIVQYLAIKMIMFIFKSTELKSGYYTAMSLFLGYVIGYIAFLLTRTVVKKTYLRIKRELRTSYQLLLVSVLMLLILTFFVTGDLAVAIYLGTTLLHVLIILVILSSLSISLINPMYLGTFGINFVVPLFIFAVTSLVNFISKTALEVSQSKFLFPVFALLSLSTFPGLFSEALLICRSVGSDEISHFIKRALFTIVISLITGLSLIIVLNISPTQYLMSTIVESLPKNGSIAGNLVVLSTVMTISLFLLREFALRFTLLTFFTNPFTISAAIALLNREDLVFVLAIASLIKFIFTVSAYRYTELKAMYYYLKNYVISLFSGALLAISLLSIME